MKQRILVYLYPFSLIALIVGASLLGFPGFGLGLSVGTVLCAIFLNAMIRLAVGRE